MKTWLYASIGLSFLFNLVFHNKPDTYKRKANETPEQWAKELFDTQRVNWERSLAGSFVIAAYSFFILAFSPNI
jgi:hypothetical protein